jgi:hypothetical protein
VRSCRAYRSVPRLLIALAVANLALTGAGHASSVAGGRHDVRYLGLPGDTRPDERLRADDAVALDAWVGVQCRSARRVPLASQRLLVGQVIAPPLPPAPSTLSRPAGLVRRALLNVDRYALTALYRRANLAISDPLVGKVNPRTPSGEALALAVTIGTGAYDPRLVGVPLPRAVRVATWLVASYACAHAAVTSGGWGAGTQPIPADLHGWQSPMWAEQFGAAGWLLWPYLATATRYHVAAMVTAEADKLLRVAPNYYALADGHLRFPGDTKAEEDMWAATIFALAAVMLPKHPHARLWRQQEATYKIASYATAADDTSTVVINGRPLQSWLSGWNVFPDGTLVNHGINPHPDYMAAVAWNLADAGIDAIAGRSVLRAALHNADLLYRAMTSLRFSSPPFRPPGGTIYQPGTAVTYYPRPDDWGTSLIPGFVTLDAAMASLRLSSSADLYLSRHIEALLALQARHTDGHTYQGWAEFRYAGREQWVAEQISRAWLLEWASARNRIKITNAVPD